MKKAIEILSIVLLVTGMSFTALAENEGTNKISKPSAATATTINGKIIDKVSGEALVGVKVSIEGTEDVAYTDFDGNFSFSALSPGNYNLQTNYISYENTTFKSIEVAAGINHSVKMVLKSVEE